VCQLGDQRVLILDVTTLTVMPSERCGVKERFLKCRSPTIVGVRKYRSAPTIL